MSEPIGFPPPPERKSPDNIIDASDWLERLRAADVARPIGRIGRFEILGEIGRGGQGVVYRAIDGESGEVVAVKRLMINEKNPDHVHRRLDNEIRALAALSHPGIVRMRSVETHGANLLLVMDWVDGVSLGEWVANRDGEPAAEEMVRIMTGIGEVIQHAHGRGVIHRDLKPSNVMVDREGNAHVLDFGLAKLYEAAPASLTGSIPFVGTLAYAAPEVIAKGPRAASPRSDLYALGVMFYEMLVGRIPYDLGGSISTAVDAILHEDPKRFDWEGVDSPLCTILQTALAKDPAQRYATVGAFNGELGRYLAGDRVAALRAPMAWIRRAALGTLSLAVAAMLIFGLGREDGGGAPPVAIESTFTPSQFLLTSVVDPKAYTINPYPILQSVSERASTELSGSPIAEARTRALLVHAFGVIGIQRPALDEGRRAVAILEDAQRTEDPAYAEALARLGVAYAHAGMPEAAAMLEQALAIERQRDQPSAAVLAEATGGLAHIHSRNGRETDFAQVEKEYAEALALFERHGEPSMGWSLALTDHARLKRHVGERQAALEAFKGAGEVLNRVPAAPPAARWRIIRERGEMLVMLRQWPEAEAVYREAIAVRGDIVDSQLPALCSNLGTTVLRQNRPREALGHYRAALQKRLEFLAGSNPEVAGFAEFAKVVRDHGLELESISPIGRLFHQHSPWVVPLFQHTTAQIATAHEALGEDAHGRALRAGLEELDRLLADAVPEVVSD